MGGGSPSRFSSRRHLRLAGGGWELGCAHGHLRREAAGNGRPTTRHLRGRWLGFEMWARTWVRRKLGPFSLAPAFARIPFRHPRRERFKEGQGVGRPTPS
jgi:hypothetical protein